jgi:hypothetical protein
MNGKNLATGEILKKPVEIVKGRILAGWAQKPPEPWLVINLGALDNFFLFFPHAATRLDSIQAC